jgi:hypothetical protein
MRPAIRRDFVAPARGAARYNLDWSGECAPNALAPRCPMSAELDVNSLNASAANAAATGDVSSAVAFLRQALDRQTSTLGPDHPDLATTLNNLALMLEKQGDTAEAGRCYLRSYTIAAAALGPDDPAVRVSHANLDAFHRAYGSNGEGKAATATGGLHEFPSVTDESAPPSPARPLPPPSVAPARQPRSPAPAGTAPPALPTSSAPEALVAEAPRRPLQSRLPLAVIGMVAATFAGAALWLAAPAGPEGRPAAAAEVAPAGAPVIVEGPPPAATAPADAPAVTRGPAPVAAAPAAATPGAAPAEAGVLDAQTPLPSGTARAGGDTSAAPPGPTAPSPANPAAPRVTDARLCETLLRGAAWRCEPSARFAAGGAVYYYTRVASARDAVIRHRWTRDGEVVRVVDLRIRANPSDGYRTFSRQSGRSLAGGEWQVAVLDSTGAVLHEQSFVIP